MGGRGITLICRETLAKLFQRPASADVRWQEIESLLLACGAEIEERAGSRIGIRLHGVRASIHAFEVSINDYLTMCTERGENPDRPYSGNVPLRIPPSVHRAAVVAASAEGKSLNVWLGEAVEYHLTR